MLSTIYTLLEAGKIDEALKLLATLYSSEAAALQKKLQITRSRSDKGWYSESEFQLLLREVVDATAALAGRPEPRVLPLLRPPERHEFFVQINRLLAGGHLPDAIEHTLHFSEGHDVDLFNEAVILSGRLQTLNRRRRSGNIAEAEFQVEWSSIVTALQEAVGSSY